MNPLPIYIILPVMRFVMAFLVMQAVAHSAPADSVTFNRDVLPVLQRNCQICHRPGEIGPMSFLTYESARPWAKAMKEAVLTRHMPPWFADPAVGHFSNERKLSDADIKTIADWADSGALEGGAKDKPAPAGWSEGWDIKPDVVFRMPKAYHVPASGTVEYVYVLLPAKFTEDTWVMDGEVRPGNRSVVHHLNVVVRPPGSHFMNDAKVGEPYNRKPADNTGPGNFNVEYLTGYMPGMYPERYLQSGSDAGRLIRAGSDIFLEIHYTANGKPADDQTELGLVLAKEPPQKQFYTLTLYDTDFEIPPQAGNYPGHTWAILKEPATLINVQPHLHLRGKDVDVKITYPSGETVDVLQVPHYSYLWQTIYVLEQPLQLPKGARIDLFVHWDNSPNNPFKMDYTKSIRWGDQSWDEMLGLYFGVIVDRDVDVHHMLAMRQFPDANQD